MPRYNLDNYVGVEERLRISRDEVQHIQSDPPVLLTDVYGYIRVTVSLKDGRTATGIEHFELGLPRAAGAESTDPLEKCETSAIGRALKHLGYPISREELDRIEQNRAQEQAQPSTVNQTMTVREAETRFWDKFAGPLGGTEWARVVALVGEWPQPITLPEWIAAGKAVHDALTAEVNKEG